MNTNINTFRQKVEAEAPALEYQGLQINVYCTMPLDRPLTVIEGTVISARFFADGTVDYFKVRFPGDIECFKGAAIGQVIFLSREEAEASLRKEG